MRSGGLAYGELCIAPRETPLAEVLRPCGYATGMVGGAWPQPTREEERHRPLDPAKVAAAQERARRVAEEYRRVCTENYKAAMQRDRQTFEAIAANPRAGFVVLP